MLEIGWISFGNRCQPCFEVIKNLSTPSVIVGSCWKIFGDLRKSFEIFGNSESVETKNLTHFTEKKLAGISYLLSCFVPNSYCCLLVCPFSFTLALSVLSLNYNGIRDQSKRVDLIQWLQSWPVTVDVVCLQETHRVSQAGFLSCLSPGFNHSSGCVVLYRPLLAFVDSWTDTGGRYLQREFSLCDKSFRICCLYAPNRNPDSGQFLEDVSDKVDPSVPTLLVGDFNTMFNWLKDRRGSNPLDDSHGSSVRLAALFDACCVVYIWRY